MTQDTRKDRRVKIVSLNVRYKSATVDEFIENHAHDVSRGGIYVKTANPFPPGTLLKFEIRLASDQAVIAGVGRVVWKRDAASSNGERPAGMGVKFIKIDEPSKSVIDRLVNTRPDAGAAYESEDEAPTTLAHTPDEAPATLVQSSPAGLTPPAASRAAPAPSSTPPMPAGRKATMLGLGIAASPPAAVAAAPVAKSTAPAASAPPRPASAPASSPPRASAQPPQGMFPASTNDDETVKGDQTVMRQAAELLEEALREAGGSMDEIGTNPLFSTGAPAPAAASPVDVAATPKPGTPEATVSQPPADAKRTSPILEVKTPSVERATAEKAKEGDEAAKARAMVSGISRAPNPKPSKAPASSKPISSRPPAGTTRESPGAKASAPAVAQTAKTGRGGGGFILLFVAVVAVGGAAFLFKDKLLGGEPPAAPPRQTAASTATAAPTGSAPTAASVDTTSATAAGSTTAAASTTASTGGPSATASATETAASALAASSVKPAPILRPAATAPATASALTVPTATPTAVPKPTAVASAATNAPTAAPKPAPKPKPTDDNPY